MRSSSSGGAALACAGPTSARARVAIATACSTKHKNVTQPNTKNHAKQTKHSQSKGNIFLAQATPFFPRRHVYFKGSPQNLSRENNSTLTQETLTEEYQNIYSAQATPFFPGVSSTFFAQEPPFCQGISLGPSQGK
jgi:hypothetical protein